jgi:N-methylhydantoinase A/oxoprolinase/acetone carboxylase beta subunit
VELHRQAKTKSNLRESGQFLIGKPLSGQEISLPHAALSQLLADKPRSVSSLVAQLSQEDPWVSSRIKRLEETGWVQRAAFTPTDALHVIGSFQRWNPEASRLGATLLAGRAGLTVEAFCERVVKTVSRRLAVAVVNKVVEEESGVSGWGAHPAVKPILKRAFGDEVQDRLGCNLILKGPLAALGAPVEAYMPQVAEKLHTQLSIPPHADVANAVGAVSGGILQRIKVTIQNLDNGFTFRAFLPEGPVDFTDIEEAVTHASETMTPIVEARAKRAGAQQIEVEVSRRDRRVRVGSGGREEIHLDTELVFTAFGRPSPRQA